MSDFTCVEMLVDMSQHSVELWVEVSSPELWGRRDFMVIGAFYYTHVVKSIPWTVIGCWPRKGYISVYIYQFVPVMSWVSIELKPVLLLSASDFCKKVGRFSDSSEQEFGPYIRDTQRIFSGFFWQKPLKWFDQFHHAQYILYCCDNSNHLAHILLMRLIKCGCFVRTILEQGLIFITFWI